MTKSRVYPLEANVLIALATPEQSLNARAAAWYREGHRFATCPMTQGALIRFHLRAVVGATAKPAKFLLESICALARKHGGTVATMDEALAAVHAGTTLLG